MFYMYSINFLNLTLYASLSEHYPFGQHDKVYLLKDGDE
jgi:hypothetical protein